MDYYKDLTPYSYFHDETEHMLNVGWLDSEHEYQRGLVSDEFMEKLAWLCAYSPEKRTPGIHVCNLCPPMLFGFHFLNLDHENLILGSGEIRVKGHGATYAAPDIILHYVMEHSYVPPEDFMAAVLGLTNKIPRSAWSITRGPYWKKQEIPNP